MALCHEVEMLLFCGTQTSVGEPARGSEIASHLISNIAGGTIRNVLVMFQYFSMMGTFNKTSHLTEHDVTMMRVPHPDIGQLWMLYLTFIRPTVVLWQDYFSGRRAAMRARDHLFFWAVSTGDFPRAFAEFRSSYPATPRHQNACEPLETRCYLVPELPFCHVSRLPQPIEPLIAGHPIRSQ